MKFSLSWLKQHLETDATLERIADTLTSVGLEVESVTDPGAALRPFIVGRVISTEQHPNADRLKICRVDTGEELINVICGAPNVREGLRVALARPGDVIPENGQRLKKGKIRGEESHGMLCSARELNLGDDEDGIMELPEISPVGTPIKDCLALDPIIDIQLTPNRVDALGVRGVARDLAAAGLGVLKDMNVPAIEGCFNSSRSVVINLPPEQSNKCSHFVGRTIRNIKNAESPQWLKDRLSQIGLHPISAIVDITQYINIDLGRPLHCFDDDKLNGNVGPRLAKDGEIILALNDKNYELSDDMVVIADEAGAQAIAGIIGGKTASCDKTTVNVFLESALFDPTNIATTGQKLQITSDARYCFERGVDPTSGVQGAEIATQMILEICGGEASHLVVGGEEPVQRRKISFNPISVKDVGGVEIPENEVKDILIRLGFKVDTSTPSWAVIVPSWRADVRAEPDLLEEVLRIYGYEKIPAVPLPRAPMPRPILTTAQRRTNFTRRTLAERGLYETITWSFLPRAHAELFKGELPLITLENPISSDLDAMRPSVLPNLIEAAGRNASRGLVNCALFEIGPRFEGSKPWEQTLIAATVRKGKTGQRHWLNSPRNIDVYDAKADALAALTAAQAPVSRLQVSGSSNGRPSPWYHPKRTGTLALGSTILAEFGEIHPQVLVAMDVSGPIVACEVFMDRIPQPKKTKRGVARSPLTTSQFQSVERDFAFVVDVSVSAEDIRSAAHSAEKSLISQVSIFDVYEGDKLESGKKSVALAVTLQPQETTLTDAQIDAVSEKIVAAVTKVSGGQLRS